MKRAIYAAGAIALLGLLGAMASQIQETNGAVMGNLGFELQGGANPGAPQVYKITDQTISKLRQLQKAGATIEINASGEIKLRQQPHGVDGIPGTLLRTK